MIATIIHFDIGRKVRADFSEAYHNLLMMLRRIPGESRWFCGENTPEQKPVPFEDEGAVLARLRERAELMGSESLSAALVSDDTDKRYPGLIEIDYIPSMGYMTLQLYRPDQVQANPTQWVAEIMLAVLAGEPETTFAYANVYDKVDGQFQFYRTTYAAFPHRQCVGWMAYVRTVLASEQLPIAAAVIPAPGGSIVVSVDEAFNLANKDHIQRANQVEMDMNDMGLLAVTDPSF